ncbi:MAG: LCP family protein [Defluviitaleaceae bacterium]|nr:LCP family protein [Defluviitaleaceae bacterium]
MSKNKPEDLSKYGLATHDDPSINIKPKQPINANNANPKQPINTNPKHPINANPKHSVNVSPKHPLESQNSFAKAPPKPPAKSQPQPQPIKTDSKPPVRATPKTSARPLPTQPQKKQQSKAAKFYKTFALAIAVLVVAVFGTAIIYGLVQSSQSTGSPGISLPGIGGGDSSQPPGGAVIHPPRINVLILGIDAETGRYGRSDLMMVLSFNTEDGGISLISVPRDTFVVMPAERIEILRNAGRNTARRSGEMRINEVIFHAGPEFGPSFAVLQVEELLEIDIHFFVRIDLDAFKFIIDEIGGVEFDVPVRMFYTDPFQGLVIDLHPGLQTLSGSQAEGLIRYRQADLNNPISPGHPDGDLGRMRMQQQLLMAVIPQVLSQRNIVNNLPAYFTMFFEHVQTDFSLLDIPRYIGLVGMIDTENMQSYTLPGRGNTISGRYYHIINEAAMREMLDGIFAE